MRLQLVTTDEEQPDYLAYSLDTPLAEWDHADLVEIPVGVHRHVVRFLQRDGRLYALKELPPALAEREWDLLRHLSEEDLPVVEVLGVIADRGADLDDILITRHLEFSLPFRFLFTRAGMPRLQESLIDAVAVLLVRIHLAGFWWGDCSLSNTLFRRDAGALAAWLVDTETGELHDTLSSGQRELDLDIAEMNILGGLLDLEAGGQLSDEVDPATVVATLRARYGQLWAELTTEQAIDVSERHLIDERLKRLNDLGFDTTEISIEAGVDGSMLRFKPVVIEAGHHQRMLRGLTGIAALENQSRRLVDDLRSYGAWLSGQEGRDLPEAVVAYRWLAEVFEPALAAVPAELRDRREPPELFHEILLHRDELVAAQHKNVRVPQAAASYASLALPFVETERALLDDDQPDD
ncbi:MAG: DUF4032 domain-containing protein [Acidimicrobiales bacterium]